MPILLKDRKKASIYDVQANDTLEDIVKKAEFKIKDWKVLAQYNFGTSEPREVLRALAETVGVATADMSKPESAANPEKVKLVPDATLNPKLLIPEAFAKDNIELDKKHKLTVNALRAPSAVAFSVLDKWFVPNLEKCELKYVLEGDGDTADKVQLDVFGSNYCECSDWNKGLGTYGDPVAMIDKPIFAKDLSGDSKKQKENELSGPGWKGEASTTDGILGRKTGSAAARYINAAFSPYTVHLRYFKADGDKKARLILEPFWPIWDEAKTSVTDADINHGGTKKAVWDNAKDFQRGTLVIQDKNGQVVHLEAVPDDKLSTGNGKEIPWNGTYRDDAINSKFDKVFLAADEAYKATLTMVEYKIKADSLKIKWEVKDTTKLKRGLLQIWDGKDKLVFQKVLTSTLLEKKKHEFAWDGKYADTIKNSKNGDTLIREDMPYRVQIQAHTDKDEKEAIALAAMHTEVRIYVHPKSYLTKDEGYDPWTPVQSLLLMPGTAWLGPEPGEGTRKWYQKKLAEFGFHPGPANGNQHEPYKIALKEFKRSVPKHKTGMDYERLAVDLNENNDTRDAIKNLEAKYKRGGFGDPSLVDGNSNTPDFSALDVETNIKDPAKDMIIWVDDRQYYTDGSAKDESNNDFMTGTMGLGNYRGGMDIGDNRVTRDEESIPRPWVPLQAEPVLLQRTQGLYDIVDVNGIDTNTRKIMRACLGPLRMDWAVFELPPDLSRINVGTYTKTYTRSRTFVAAARKAQSAKHTPSHAAREITYYNCPEALGGIRPGGLATYAEKAFGTADLHLAPWEVSSVAADETIATVLHEHLVGGQVADTDLFEAKLGAAGAYFRPSIVAGDGYRVRSELKFKKFGSYDFPNGEVLDTRYPQKPYAHSARLRVWRRSSVRGYLYWAAANPNHWPGMLNGMRDYYRAAHVYFVQEAAGALQNFAINTVFDSTNNTHKDRYKNIVHYNLGAKIFGNGDNIKDKARMTLDADSIWPWAPRNDLGWPDYSPVNLAQANIYSGWLDGAISATWRKFRDGLLFALVKEVEKKGYLRGHLFVEFQASPTMDIYKFECNNPVPHVYWSIRKGGSGSGLAPNTNCPALGCINTTVVGHPHYKLSSLGYLTYADGWPLPAVGIALGATWLFTSSTAAVWAHEIGHHRHLEHAASAPGGKLLQHDSQVNTTTGGWPGGTAPLEKNWDRECIMSYSDEATLYFCGKCLLKHSGWKVEALALPASNVKEP